MKRKLMYLLIIVATFSACKKDQTKQPVLLAKCTPQRETSNFLGTMTTREYTYGADGNMALMKLFIGGDYHVLQDSILVRHDRTETYTRTSAFIGLNQTVAIYNADIFTGRPSKCDVSITFGDGTGQHNYWSYFFFYDDKNRLVKVGEQTNNIIGDYEYDLTISYDDKDNVTSLSYENTTGPREIILITATGYDDKLNPYAGLKYWPFIKPFAWDNSDPEPIFNALSKNNLLGYKFRVWTRSTACEYNDNGFPIKKNYTNITSSGSVAFQDFYTYLCQ